MLLPYDIETKKFERAFRGYSIEEVDEFMQIVLSDYEALYKENGILKGKLSVLAEKVEEYKKMEDSLRDAIVSAQKMGESMIKEATSKSEYILNETTIKAEKIINNINLQIYKEKQMLEDAKRDYKSFRNKLTAMYEAQISLLSDVEESVEPEGAYAAQPASKEPQGLMDEKTVLNEVEKEMNAQRDLDLDKYKKDFEEDTLNEESVEFSSSNV